MGEAVVQMRGTTEGGRMRAAAWMRLHRCLTRCVAWTRGPGGWHEQGVANGGEQGGGTDEEGGMDDGTAQKARLRTCDVTSVCSSVLTGAP